jgi:NADPH:quinone reductase-like Zn-dependent oxidoreductase
MQAIHYSHYGPLGSLALREMPIPRLRRPDEVLVRVHATSLHIADCFAVRGTPLLIRLATGLLRPRCTVPGQDFAGAVIEVGSAVRAIRPGDRVFGIADGTCAEFARSDERRLATLPPGLDFAAGAALPTAGLAALHGLRDAARLRPGQRILIHGASGGVGSMAIQLARSLGAEVTAVCSTRNLDLVRSLGADHAIDYVTTDWTQDDRRYDVILDNVENLPLAARRRALAPGGTLLCNSGTGAAGFAFLRRLLAPLVLAPFVRQRLRRFLSTPNAADLRSLGILAAAGTLRSVIDSTHPLAATPMALTRVESGHVRGRVVIHVAQ